jgi:hypothetical protein
MSTTAGLLLAWVTCLAVSQSTLNPAECISANDITTFANCNYLYDTTDSCSSLQGKAFDGCYCNQALFNAILGYAFAFFLGNNNQ